MTSASEVTVHWQLFNGVEWGSLSDSFSTHVDEVFRLGLDYVDCNLAPPQVFRINLNTMRGGTVIPVRRITSLVTANTRWEYQEDNYWMDFSIQSCEQINIAYESGRSQTVLYHGPSNQEHVLNLINMYQTNTATGDRVLIRLVRSAIPQGKLRDEMVSRIMENVQVVNLCEDTCSICLDNFDSTDDNTIACCLPNCKGHYFHRNCIRQQLQGRGKCAVCSMFYIVTEGSQPVNGVMEVQTLPAGRAPLASFETVGTITILYRFPNGIQGAEHPHPGTPYYGTQRMAYLPDTSEGRQVLALLRRCFDLRHTFAIGTSLTTGLENSIVWNGVHHKTSRNGGVAHFGWPDPTYFMRVKEELKARGIE